MKASMILLPLVLLLAAQIPSSAHSAMMTEEIELGAEPDDVLSALGGELVLRGTPGPSQIFRRAKALRCERAKAGEATDIKKGSCQKAIYFDLNRSMKLETGFYLVGFENSVYPGLVEIRPGETNTIDLHKVTIPATAAGGRVFRDFSKLGEQRKQYFAAWASGGSFFQQSEYDFGDYYLTKWPLRPAVPNLSYEYCERKSPVLSEEAVDICKAWNGRSYQELSDLFEFDWRGRFKQFWVGRPGGVFRFHNKRHLVSAPMGAGEWALVFAGNYSIETLNEQGKARISSVTVGNATGRYGKTPLHSLIAAQQALLESIQFASETPKPEALAAPVSEIPAPPTPPTCSSVRLWKTELRSYCRRDNDEGCNRTSVQACQPMIDRGL